MQRCFFFLFLLVASVASAQPVDIKELNFSVWFDELKATELRAEALLILEFKKSTDQLVFDFSDKNTLSSVVVVEGRDKGQLSFKHDNSRIKVYLPKSYSPGKKLSLKFRYRLSLDNNKLISTYDSISHVVALNSSAFIEPDQKLSHHFFPALKGEKALIRANVSFPQDMSSMFPGELEFVTLSGNSKSYYWTTPKEVSLDKFYLRVGQFDDIEIEEPEDDPVLYLIDPGLLKREALREKLQPCLENYQKSIDFSVNDSLIDFIDELTSRKEPGLYLNYGDIDRPIDQITFKQEQILALLLNNYDTLKASNLNFKWNLELHSSYWLDSILQKKWPAKAGEQASELNARFRMRYYQRELKDTLQKLKLVGYDSSAENFSDQIIDQKKLLAVSISYRYISSEKGLLLFVKQDTNVAPLYNFPLLLRAYLRDSVVEQVLQIKKVALDTLLIPILGSPRSAEVHLGKYFPGLIHEKKPESYHLYMLSKGSNPGKREEALVNLFQTSNKNLLSTVLGIAMDSPDSNIRLRALEKAKDLDPVGQRKLEDTLKKLANSDHEEKVRAKARELIKQYYPDK